MASDPPAIGYLSYLYLLPHFLLHCNCFVNAPEGRDVNFHSQQQQKKTNKPAAKIYKSPGAIFGDRATC